MSIIRKHKAANGSPTHCPPITVLWGGKTIKLLPALPPGSKSKPTHYIHNFNDLDDITIDVGGTKKTSVYEVTLFVFTERYESSQCLSPQKAADSVYKMLLAHFRRAGGILNYDVE